MKSLLNKLHKKPADNPVGGVAAVSKESRGLSIRRMVLMAFLLAAVVLVITAGFTYLQFVLLGNGRAEALRKAQTATLAARLGSRIEGVADSVAAAGRSAALASALGDNDSTVVSQHAAALGRLIPAVLDVRILPAGYHRIDATGQPPLSYACLDLIHRAETERLPPPVEVHLFGTKGQHMVVVRPVIGAHGIAGTVVVTMDVDLLKKWVQPLSGETNGYVELRQGAAETLVLAAVGNKALQGGGAPYTAAVPGTAWQLAQWLPAPAALTAAQRLAFFSVFGFAAAALIAGFMALGLMCGRIVRGDLIAVVKQAVEMVSGGRQHNFEVRLAESREVLRALEQRVQPKQVHPDFAKAAAMREDPGIIVDEGPSGDDDLAPSVLFMDKDAVEVEEVAGTSADNDKKE